MRIYYIGQLWSGGTCGERMRTLRTMGHDVFPFDTSPWTIGGFPVARSLEHRFNVGPSIWGLNRTLAKHALDVGPVDLVWVDKGRWLYPHTLEAVRSRLDARTLHYSPDAQLVLNQSRHFEACLPLYDYIVTTKPFELALYESRGARCVQLVLQGFDPRFASYSAASSDATAWSSSLCFIGHCERYYTTQAKALADADLPLRVWGSGWPEFARRNPWAAGNVAGDGAWAEDYLRALAHARIGLGLLSKLIPETTTTRSFEIPAMGTFLLAERTDEHASLFEEGKEAEFFADSQELVDKARFYLANNVARDRIAIAGKDRCLRSGYSSREQLARVLAMVSQ